MQQEVSNDTDEAIGSSGSIDILSVPPTMELNKWDGRDVNAYALIALSMKCGIIPQMHLYKTTKEVWYYTIDAFMQGCQRGLGCTCIIVPCTQ